MTDLIFYSNPDFNKTKPITTSLIVADVFEKPHNDLLKVIRQCIEENNEIGNVGKFSLVEYTDKKGEKRPYYILDRDAFMFLVMHLSGKKANCVKAQFIKKFNQMEQELLRRQETRMIGKTIRKDFTDFIKIINNGEDNAFVKWSYKLFTDIVYKIALGKTCKQLKIEKGIRDYQKNLRNYLTARELDKVQYWEEKMKEIAINKGWIKLPNKEIFANIKNYLRENKILLDN